MFIEVTANEQKISINVHEIRYFRAIKEKCSIQMTSGGDGSTHGLTVAEDYEMVKAMIEKVSKQS